MTLARYQRIQQVLRSRQPDLSLLAEEVHKPHNLSAMLRSADAVGIGTVHAVHPTGGLPTYNATSASAEKWVELRVHPGLDHALAAVRAEGMRVVAAHWSPRSVDFREVDYRGPCCLLLGNEKQGVSAAAAEAADDHVVIPMLGMVQSLNVSVATAVLLFEAQRQRREAGLYDGPRLSQAERDAMTVRWMHPRAAARLAAAGLPLPSPEADGSLPEHTLRLLAMLPGGAGLPEEPASPDDQARFEDTALPEADAPLSSAAHGEASA